MVCFAFVRFSFFLSRIFFISALVRGSEKGGGGMHLSISVVFLGGDPRLEHKRGLAHRQMDCSCRR